MFFHLKYFSENFFRTIYFFPYTFSPSNVHHFFSKHFHVCWYIACLLHLFRVFWEINSLRENCILSLKMDIFIDNPFSSHFVRTSIIARHVNYWVTRLFDLRQILHKFFYVYHACIRPFAARSGSRLAVAWMRCILFSGMHRGAYAYAQFAHRARGSAH